MNDAPVLEAISDRSIDEGAAFEYQLTASDIDANVVAETLTFEAVETPEWMTVSLTGLITGTPDNEDVGDHTATLKVTDSAGERIRRHSLLRSITRMTCQYLSYF